MSQPILTFTPVRSAAIAAFGAVLALTACGPGPAPIGISDRFERENRDTHAMNLALDKNVIRPLALGAANVLPKPVTDGISNFADNVGLPGAVVNDILQLRLDRALQNTVRFAINTTIGLGGLFDPASPMGVVERPTDFGETLAVWGMVEGEYIELPFFGPSTQRDALGKVVDMGLDPVGLLLPSDKKWIGTVAKLAARIGDRGRYSETVDSILYDSADGYAQARLLYLENRRHELGQTVVDTEFEDPYAAQE